ncbi:MAG: hypothetical protein HRT45_07715 [Bdellovibrionales bacterium]|nr:hypothetical protein [Bdellovibrionales bacterium]
MLKAVLALTLASSLLLVFQNCEQMLENKIAPDGSSDKAVVDIEAADYVQLEYSQGLKTFERDNEKAFIDLTEATLTITDSSGQKRTCVIPEDALIELAEILTEVEICKPAPPEPGEMVCLALGIPDIELFKPDGSSTWLQPEVCKTGKFLCGEKDDQLRTLLKDINCE